MPGFLGVRYDGAMTADAAFRSWIFSSTLIACAVLALAFGMVIRSSSRKRGGGDALVAGPYFHSRRETSRSRPLKSQPIFPCFPVLARLCVILNIAGPKRGSLHYAATSVLPIIYRSTFTILLETRPRLARTAR
jgi:hypothetical protein